MMYSLFRLVGFGMEMEMEIEMFVNVDCVGKKELEN